METDEEMYILKLIIDGFHDVNKVFNRSLSLMSRMKITNTPEMEDYLFNEYFKKRAERVLDLLQSHHEHPRYEIRAKSQKTMKKVDLMRIQNMNMSFGGSGDTFDQLIIIRLRRLLTQSKQHQAAAAAAWLLSSRMSG